MFGIRLSAILCFKLSPILFLKCNNLYLAHYYLCKSIKLNVVQIIIKNIIHSDYSKNTQHQKEQNNINDDKKNSYSLIFCSGFSRSDGTAVIYKGKGLRHKNKRNHCWSISRDR